MEHSGLKKIRVDEIVLVEGSTRIPKVQQRFGTQEHLVFESSNDYDPNCGESREGDEGYHHQSLDAYGLITAGIILRKMSAMEGIVDKGLAGIKAAPLGSSTARPVRSWRRNSSTIRRLV